MDMAFTSFDNRFGTAQATAPYFPALVTLLASHQASQPTARMALLLESGRDQPAIWLESLVDLLVQRRGGAISGGALQGCFNPAVPNPHSPLTRQKAL